LHFILLLVLLSFRHFQSVVPPPFHHFRHLDCFPPFSLLLTYLDSLQRHLPSIYSEKHPGDHWLLHQFVIHQKYSLSQNTAHLPFSPILPYLSTLFPFLLPFYLFSSFYFIFFILFFS